MWHKSWQGILPYMVLCHNNNNKNKKHSWTADTEIFYFWTRHIANWLLLRLRDDRFSKQRASTGPGIFPANLLSLKLMRNKPVGTRSIRPIRDGFTLVKWIFDALPSKHQYTIPSNHFFVQHTLSPSFKRLSMPLWPELCIEFLGLLGCWQLSHVFLVLIKCYIENTHYQHKNLLNPKSCFWCLYAFF